MIINSNTGFGYVINGQGKVIQKLKCQAGIDVICVDGNWQDVADQSALDAISIFKYNPNELIAWAMQSIFSEAIIPHMAAFLDFANKANKASKANFLTYAAAVGLTDTANAIITKAIELGADIQ